ncbi:hypothetical protein Caci_8604 [Catenulispora acidiphila DSM 44928]|uniref:Uncharacterized protein n=1 Tax=Catenulispora acidiphila (strain DSM 44928 / JCM 14897 / NBRC 102108 / NRRL B-24433 / ID139908) TaxID=479433 RepID=C7Q090_CATAD|nr:hypothetical protein Caci_8604 [Catenulispora acidiphila DSM 44928]
MCFVSDRKPYNSDLSDGQWDLIRPVTEFERADGLLRAGQLCQILDVGTEPKHREGMRSRLKRLAARGILAETEPGLFALIAKTTLRQ